MPNFDPTLQPKTEITLARAEEGHTKIWVYETHEEVVSKTEDAVRDKLALVTFSRVQGIGYPGKPFSTKPNNVVNVSDITD